MNKSILFFTLLFSITGHAQSEIFIRHKEAFSCKVNVAVDDTVTVAYSLNDYSSQGCTDPVSGFFGDWGVKDHQQRSLSELLHTDSNFSCSYSDQVHVSSLCGVEIWKRSTTIITTRTCVADKTQSQAVSACRALLECSEHIDQVMAKFTPDLENPSYKQTLFEVGFDGSQNTNRLSRKETIAAMNSYLIYKGCAQ